MRFSILVTTIVLLFNINNIVRARILEVPNQYGTIQNAINAAGVDDTVLVHPGVYSSIDFLGKAILVASEYIFTNDDNIINNTIIDAENSGHVVRFRTFENRFSRLTGFTIRNGRATDGGGIYCPQASPTLSHLIISNNFVTEDGGGIYGTEDSSPVISDVIIRENTSSEQGGGLYFAEDCDPRLTNVLIEGNSGSSGGGIYIRSNSSIELTNVRIINNEAASLGGGIACHRDCEMQMNRCVVAGNSAESLYAGGIYLGISNAELENVTICGNSTDGYGGGLNFSGRADISVVNAIFWENIPEQITGRGNNNPQATIEISFSDLMEGQNGISIVGNSRVLYRNSNITSNPLFENIDQQNFFLTAESPCIDAGDPDSPADPDGSVSDIGAYYFGQQNDVEYSDKHEIPVDFETMVVYPNPFNSRFQLSFTIGKPGVIKTEVFDLTGKLLFETGKEFKPIGTHIYEIDATDWLSGIYIARLLSPTKTEIVRFVCLK